MALVFMYPFKIFSCVILQIVSDSLRLSQLI